MRRRWFIPFMAGVAVITLILVVVEVLFGAVPNRIYAPEELEPKEVELSLDMLHLPLIFQSNVGQADQGFPFVLRSVHFAAGFTPTSIVAAVVRHPANAEEGQQPAEILGNRIVLTFKDANQAMLVGQDPLKGSVNAIIGQDKSSWHNHIPAFRSLVYNSLYAGVQMFVNGDAGSLEYSFLLEPRGNLSDIRIVVEGAEKLRLDDAGNLVMETRGGPIVQTRPRFVEQQGETKGDVEGRFIIISDNEYGFEVEKRTPNTQLLIDPTIIFATYFGGTGQEGMLGTDNGGDDFIGRGFDVAIGPDGNVFVIGMTFSPDLPVTNSSVISGTTDVFVMRIDPTLPPGQQLVYATFIGGSSTERGRAIAPLDDGSVYITGHTSSDNFPTSAGVVQQFREGSGAYLARLTPDGSFDIGTFIGSAFSYHPNSVVFSKRANETEGFVYVAGSARPGSGSDATEGSFQTSHAGGDFDGFLVKLDTELTGYEYLTYLGGTNRDVIMDLDVNDGFAFVAGTTTSLDFPTTELAAQPLHSQEGNTQVDCAPANRPRQCFDALVARFNRDGSALVYSTFIGADREEFARGIGVASNNQATITGGTRATSGNLNEIFVIRLEAGGENTLWDERLTTQGTAHGEEVVVDQFGRGHFVGTISSDGLATGLNGETFQGGVSDIFYGRITAVGQVDYFSYLGGAGTDRGFAIAAAGTSQENFCALVAGSTTSDDIETLNALEGGESRSGGADLLLYALCDVQPSITQSDFHKSVSPIVVEVGAVLNYTIEIMNNGDQAAPLSISDLVPENVTVTGVVGCERTGNNVTCSLSAPQGTTAIQIQARAGEQCPSSFTNTAILQVGNQQFTASATAQIICPPPLCPNGEIDPGEQCDDGNNLAGDGCRPGCILEFCGDGILQPIPRPSQEGEQCDDGNQNDNDSCTNACTSQPVLGDSCSNTGSACAGELVCGQRCGYVECDRGFLIFGMCFLGDSYWLCKTDDPQCMLEDDATWIIGP